MPPGQRGRKAQKDDLEANIEAAQKRTGLRNYKHLFIFPNAEAIRESSNIQDQNPKGLKFNKAKFGELYVLRNSAPITPVPKARPTNIPPTTI